jgi:transposase IS66 family protein
VLEVIGRSLPQSLMSQAIDYALSQWSALEVYLNDGRVEIDNNIRENAIRPTAPGRKNWLRLSSRHADSARYGCASRSFGRLPPTFPGSACGPGHRQRSAVPDYACHDMVNDSRILNAHLEPTARVTLILTR